MLNGRNNALRHSLNIILCPSIFWGPRLIARSPRRRRREKNLEPQKIDGISRLHVSCVKISIHYCATKITICIITPHVMVAKLHDSASWQHLAAGARSRNLGLIFSTISVFYNFNWPLLSEHPTTSVVQSTTFSLLPSSLQRAGSSPSMHA